MRKLVLMLLLMAPLHAWAAAAMITVTGHFVRSDNVTPALGQVMFELKQALNDTSNGTTFDTTPRVAAIDGSGNISISLVSTNDPVINPAGGTYKITKVLDGVVSVMEAVVPYNAPGGTISVAALTPSSASLVYGGSSGGASQAAINAAVAAARVYTVTDYGAVHDGTTDDCSAVQAAITAAMGANGNGPGGTVYFPAGTYRINCQLLLPNDGTGAPTVPPKQPNLRLVGEAAEFSGEARVPKGGSILDLRYSGPVAKIDTRGLGNLEITGLTMAALGGSDSTPFIQTTNTTLLIHHAGFYGSSSSPGLQDAIVAGGQTEAQTDGTSDSAFQGYGTVIDTTYFTRVRRAFFCRTWCNSAVFTDNTIWSQSGFSTGAAIDLDGGLGGGGQCIGNVITGNLIETNHYAYGIRVGYSQGNYLAGNMMWDPGVGTLAFYQMDTGALLNTILDGYHVNSTPLMSETGGAGASNTTVVSGITGQAMQLGNASSQITFYGLDMRYIGNGALLGHFIHSNGTEYYNQMSGTAANPEQIFYLKPNGGSADAFLRLHYYGTASMGLSAQFYENRDGDVKLRAKAGSTTWLGDINGTHLFWQESTGKLVFNSATAMAVFGGVTSGNVGLKPNGATLQVRLADDSLAGDFTARNITATGPVQTQSIINATPSIATACAAGTAGAMVYVDDSNDTAVSHMCFCGTAADDSTYAWRRADAPGTACP